MTRHPVATTEPIRITFTAGPTLPQALANLSISPVDGEVNLLPSSLRRSDRLAATLREQLREHGIRSHLVLPMNPIAEITRFRTRDRRHPWVEIESSLPDNHSRRVRLPRQVCSGSALWTVTDVDAVSGYGPFVLDLLARYLHPVSRVRHLATRAHADAVVDVNLAARIDRCVVCKNLGEFTVVGVTGDRVAAELLALALADEDLSSDRSVAGPWEERVVQRATELELGVQVPQQISIEIPDELNQEVRDSLRRVVARFGVLVP